jgi:hypothetical protein
MKGDLDGALTEIIPVLAVEPEFRRATITGCTSQIAVDGPDSGGSDDLNLFDELLKERLSLRRGLRSARARPAVGCSSTWSWTRS